MTRMLKRLLLATLFSWLAISAPASAAIAFITGNDTNGSIAFATAGSGSATLVATLPVGSPGIPVGGLAHVIVPVRNSGTPTGCVDSKSNTYTANYALVGTSVSFIRSFRSVIGTALVAGDTITCTLNTSASSKSVIVLGFSVPDPTPLDAASVTNSGSGTTFTAGPTGTLACPGGGSGCEALVASETAANSGTITPDAGFTVVGSFTGVGTYVQYKIVNATTAQSWSVTTSAGSGNWVAELMAYKAASSGGATSGASIMGMVP